VKKLSVRVFPKSVEGSNGAWFQSGRSLEDVVRDVGGVVGGLEGGEGEEKRNSAGCLGGRQKWGRSSQVQKGSGHDGRSIGIETT